MKIVKRRIVNRKLFLGISFLLLAAAIASAQVQLEEKSSILPGQQGFWVAVPQFEFNTQTGETLIVWIDYGSPDRKDEIIGRIVDASGVTLGGPFTIVKLVENPVNSPHLSLAYNRVTNEFLLAYNDRPNNAGYDVYLLRLKPDGHPIGNAIDITSSDPRTASQENAPTALVFNPETGGYLVSVPPYYAFVTPDGTLNGPLHQIKGGLGHLLLREFAIAPSSGKLLVLAEEHTPYSTPLIESGDYSLASVDLSNLEDLKAGDFVKINDNHLLNPAPDQNRSTLLRLLEESLSFTSPDSPIVYFTANHAVQGRKMNANGDLTDQPFAAFNSPVESTQLLFSTAAFSTTSGDVRGILIAVEDEGIDGASSVWAQALNENGKPVGTPQKLHTTAENEKIVDGGEIIALPVQPGDSVARFVYYGLLQKRADFDQSLQWYDVGSQILKLNISLNVQ